MLQMTEDFIMESDKVLGSVISEEQACQTSTKSPCQISMLTCWLWDTHSYQNPAKLKCILKLGEFSLFLEHGHSSIDTVAMLGSIGRVLVVSHKDETFVIEESTVSRVCWAVFWKVYKRFKVH